MIAKVWVSVILKLTWKLNKYQGHVSMAFGDGFGLDEVMRVMAWACDGISGSIRGGKDQDDGLVGKSICHSGLVTQVHRHRVLGLTG